LKRDEVSQSEIHKRAKIDSSVIPKSTYISDAENVVFVRVYPNVETDFVRAMYLSLFKSIWR